MGEPTEENGQLPGVEIGNVSQAFQATCHAAASAFLSEYTGENKRCAEVVAELIKHHGSKVPFDTLDLQGNQPVLKGNQINDEIVPALLAVLKQHNVTSHLNLSYNTVTDKGAACIAEFLRQNTRMEGISLFLNEITAEGAGALYGALKAGSSAVEHIDLGYNRIGGDGGLRLAQMLQRTPSVTSVNVENTYLDMNGLQQVLIALQTNRTTEDINLGRPVLSSQGVGSLPHHLGKMLKSNVVLKELRLPWWSLCCSDMFTICQGLLVNQTLVHLDLVGNKIAPDGAEYLATYLSLNGALKALNLESNRIQDGGTLALARALTTGRSGLEWLNIKFNSIQPEGLKAMARAIRASCALRYVYVWGNEFDHDTCQDYTYLLSGAVPRVSVEGGLDISTYIVDGVCSVAHVECKEFKPLFKRKRFRV
ncbi:leucine-rich repeat-containing protein 34-like [Sycon ciliatum]|uniref:leucine-rich repeat-containing protein 34-like n=1 Tax=Sycon ciliatum TaxID=27933 RepID=UPI0031F69ED4